MWTTLRHPPPSCWQLTQRTVTGEYVVPWLPVDEARADAALHRVLAKLGVRDERKVPVVCPLVESETMPYVGSETAQQRKTGHQGTDEATPGQQPDHGSSRAVGIAQQQTPDKARSDQHPDHGSELGVQQATERGANEAVDGINSTEEDEEAGVHVIDDLHQQRVTRFADAFDSPGNQDGTVRVLSSHSAVAAALTAYQDPAADTPLVLLGMMADGSSNTRPGNVLRKRRLLHPGKQAELAYIGVFSEALDTLELLRMDALPSDIADQLARLASQRIVLTYDAPWLLGRIGSAASAAPTHILDVLVAHWLLHPDGPTPGFAELIKDNTQVLRTLGMLRQQAVRDARACCQHTRQLVRRIQQQGMLNVFAGTASAVHAITIQMNHQAVRIAAGEIQSHAPQLTRQITELEKAAYRAAGQRFLLTSPKQVARTLFQLLRLPAQPDTSTASLHQVLEAHPVVAMILEHRHLVKVRSCWIQGLLRHATPIAAKPGMAELMPSWSAVRTATGRIACSTPNLQNLPRAPLPLGNGESINIRNAFRARPGYRWLSADYVQLELALAAHFSGDQQLIAELRDGGDFHRSLASQVIGKAPENISNEERNMAKRMCYSVLYGASASKVADDVRAFVAPAGSIDAGAMAKAMQQRYPQLQALAGKIHQACKQNGYVETLAGRRRWLADVASGKTAGQRAHARRQAFNTLMQGSAADLMNAAVVRVSKLLGNSGLGARLVAQMHDEVILEVEAGAVQQVKSITVRAMEQAGAALRVPLRVRTLVADTWALTETQHWSGEALT